MPPRALFVPLNAPALLEMLPVAEALRASAGSALEPLVLLPRLEAFNEASHAALLAAGVRALSPAEVPAPPEQAPLAGLRRLPWKLGAVARGAAYRLPSRGLAALAGNLDAYAAQLRAARALLARERVAVVATVGDRHLGWEAALIRAANERGLGSLIVPYAVSDPGSDAALRLGDPERAARVRVRGPLRLALAAAFPRWTREHEGQRLFFYAPAEALAAWRVGVMPRDPWSLGGGAATRMAVENEQARRAFLAEGVPADKLLVTGKPRVDLLHAALQGDRPTATRRALGLPEDRPVVLCALPQLGEQGLLPWDRHWEEIRWLLATLAAAAPGAVLLSLHPKCDPATYAPLAAEHGAVMGDRPVYELIAACDVYVSAYSSTVVQAIGAARPTLVLDLYGLHSAAYADAPGVQLLTAREAVAPALARLLEDLAWREALAARQRAAERDWALLDGRCTARVAGALRALARG